MSSSFIFCALDQVPGISPVQPGRFVWHLTHPSKRQSIQQYGLLPQFSVHDCVFANNQSEFLLNFYPICIDTYTMDIVFYDCGPEVYDYWRIDTFLAGAKWYVDPLMKADRKFMSKQDREFFLGKEENFICTEQRIPTKALKLFVYDSYPQTERIFFTEGCAHVRQQKLPLRPAQKWDFENSGSPTKAA